MYSAQRQFFVELLVIAVKVTNNLGDISARFSNVEPQSCYPIIFKQIIQAQSDSM